MKPNGPQQSDLPNSRKAPSGHRENAREASRIFACWLEAKAISSKVWSSFPYIDGNKKSATKKAITEAQNRFASCQVLHSRVHVPPKQKATYMVVRESLKRPCNQKMDSPSTLSEVRKAFPNTKRKRPGSGGIHPILLKGIPEYGLKELMRFEPELEAKTVS